MKARCHEINITISKDRRQESTKQLYDLEKRFARKTDGTGYVYLIEFADRIFKYGRTNDLKLRMRYYLSWLNASQKFVDFGAYYIRYIIDTDQPIELESKLARIGSPLSDMGYEFRKLGDSEIRTLPEDLKKIVPRIKFVSLENKELPMIEKCDKCRESRKVGRPVMFSEKVNTFLDGMESGTRSELVNAVMEGYITRQEKKAGKPA